LVCVEDEDVLPDLSSTDVIIKKLENYSNIRANVNEFSCPLNFYNINENIIPNMAMVDGNNLKNTIYSQRSLGIQNKIYI